MAQFMTPLGFGDPLRLGPYRLLGVLGEGGMGKVYVGQDSAGAVTAVKVLHPELTHDPNLAQRFLREAQTARSVESGGVARVLAAELDGGRPWIASEFLSGPTLEQAVTQRGPLEEPALRALAHSLAGTLRDIHAAGLIHRDLKPANIVLTSTGPRVIDFGIARPEHGLTLTTTGQVPATPGYGAPEQVTGQRVSPAADVFSLGAVLAYAASGRRAYDGPHVASLQYAVVHGEPDLTAVPGLLQPLIRPCLSKDPALRPSPEQIAAVFAPPRGAQRVWKHGALAEEIKEHEAQTKQYTTVVGVPVQRRPSRRRFLASLATGGAVLLAGGGATAWWLRGEDLPEAGATPPPARLLASSVEGGSSSDKAPKPLWGPLPVAAEGSPPPIVLRDVVIFAAKGGGLTARKVTDGKEKWVLPDIDATARYVAMADGRFAAADSQGNVHIHDASTSERLWSASAGATCVLAADATTVYVGTADDTIRAVATADGHKVRWTKPLAYAAPVDTTAQAVAAEGHLVVTSQDGSVTALLSATGKEAWHRTGQTSDGRALHPFVDSGVVYLGGASLCACGLSDGKEIWREIGTYGPPVLDGADLLAMTAQDWGAPHPRLMSYDTATGDYDSSWLAVPEGDAAPLAAPVFQGSSLWLAEGGDAKGVTVFDRSTGHAAWTYRPTRGGTWRMTATGNRVFLLNAGDAVAMPVF
ncbi:PQQ-binding-like beta-propeller repeat protein [Streptomyces sp. NPDC056938]|uniref:serine/threonine-protein kinase n=1 Tax=unclassified Streptomyces TaxID=2593676 RepID=UPI003628BCC1